MDGKEVEEIIEAYIEAINDKTWDRFSNYATSNVTLEMYQRGKFQWKRTGIDSLNDHAKNVMLKIVPDYRISDIMHKNFNDEEITLVAQLKGTITGKADIVNYLDSNREATHQEFQSQVTIMLIMEDSKVSKIKTYLDLFDVMLAMNVIKFVEDRDTASDYLQKIINDGIL